MQIVFSGQTEFRLKNPDLKLIIGSQEVPKEDCDLVILNNPNLENLPTKQKILNWPGEYEIQGVMTTIFNLSKNYQEPIYAFKFLFEELAFGWLPKLEKITEKIEEQFGTIDILFLTSQVSSEVSQNILESLEPKIVIPMDFDSSEIATLAQKFNFGQSEPLSELKIKKSELKAEHMEFKILTNQKLAN